MRSPLSRRVEEPGSRRPPALERRCTGIGNPDRKVTRHPRANRSKDQERPLGPSDLVLTADRGSRQSDCYFSLAEEGIGMKWRPPCLRARAGVKEGGCCPQPTPNRAGTAGRFGARLSPDAEVAGDKKGQVTSWAALCRRWNTILLQPRQNLGFISYSHLFPVSHTILFNINDRAYVQFYILLSKTNSTS